MSTHSLHRSTTPPATSKSRATTVAPPPSATLTRTESKEAEKEKKTDTIEEKKKTVATKKKMSSKKETTEASSTVIPPSPTSRSGRTIKKRKFDDDDDDEDEEEEDVGIKESVDNSSPSNRKKQKTSKMTAAAASGRKSNSSKKKSASKSSQPKKPHKRAINSRVEDDEDDEMRSVDGEDSEGSHDGYPPPLLHPGDDLDGDPECPVQTLTEWREDENRNPVTQRRRTIYIVAPPQSDEQEFDKWAQPLSVAQRQDSGAASSHTTITPPRIQDVASYLRAVYLGLEVKLLPSLKLQRWDTAQASHEAASDSSSVKQHKGKAHKKPATTTAVALNTGSELVRVRTRASADGVFLRQLNLNDLLDAAISLVPKDAYALVFIVAHDLYESADDLFTCGRAYGGDRVAVISTARYHPLLDTLQGVDIEDVWPASHFAPHAPKRQTGKRHATSPATRRIQAHDAAVMESIPLQAALIAHQQWKHNVANGDAPPAAASSSSRSASESPSDLHRTRNGLWLGRVCKTVSHELGHCFCLEHCVNFACCMQGSANLREDARQPPYLCPEEHAKLTEATGVTANQREAAILKFADQHAKEVQLFAAYAAWIRAKEKHT